ncbi:MAG: glutamine amidotransferase subunit PdxT [Actinomycetota bacterium]|jgi:5'-phosphate synthase pdxT subunit
MAPSGVPAGTTVGVLALQGAFESHQQRLTELGVLSRQVRTPHDLAAVDALVMPGGESTTMSKLLLTSGLFDPLAERIVEGLPVLGTCAGMILLAAEVLDGRPDQRSFGAIDVTVRRNGYGRQLDSFETELEVSCIEGGPFHGVFIRAPKVERVGPGVEVLAEHGGVPVLLRQGPITVASFHPELAGDRRIHGWFVAGIHHTPTTLTESS